MLKSKKVSTIKPCDIICMIIIWIWAFINYMVLELSDDPMKDWTLFDFEKFLLVWGGYILALVQTSRVFFGWAISTI